jgi:hypothetical protein
MPMLTDSNNGNLDSDDRTQHYCDHVIDGYKNGIYPDCCNGYGAGGTPDSLYTCNGDHSCR